MSDTQIVIVLVAGAAVFIAICCLILIMILRLQRVVRSQFETIDNLLATLRAGRGQDVPGEPRGE
ncbi:MAG TPA: hypothetical protein VJT72_17720 [Pseudonocardiaceae bacterium]|nr:hypothetical protein [Pseudonocardiaceae bacterium]